MSLCKRVILLPVTLALLMGSYAYAESSAVKYTPDGGAISVKAREEECGRPGYTCVITTVEDGGIGISKDFLARIFDQFERERTTTETGVQGSGLGPAIARHNMALMGGDIRIESELGEGTRVIRELKDPQKRAIPIVTMTVNAFDEDKKKAFASGMDGFIAKPVDISQFVTTLDELLRKK